MSNAPSQTPNPAPQNDPFLNNFNSCEVVGRVGVLPEIKLTKKSPVTNTLLYVTNMYDGEQGRVKRVTRIPLIMFGQRGQEFAQCVGKGDAVRVRGRIQENVWKDQKTQSNRSRLELVVMEYEVIRAMVRKEAA